MQTLNEWIQLRKDNKSETWLITGYCEDYDIDPDTFYFKRYEPTNSTVVNALFVSPLEDWGLEVGVIPVAGKRGRALKGDKQLYGRLMCAGRRHKEEI